MNHNKHSYKLLSKIAAAAGLTLLLTSCQSQPANPATIPVPQAAPSPTPETPAPTEPVVPETAAPKPADPEPIADPQTDPSAATIPVRYKLDHIYRVVPNGEDVEKKVVLLTFDDGPKDKTMIETMIDVLDKHKAKAIFFVNGYRVKQNPDLLKLIHERGQIIGNHSWDHIDLKKESEDKVHQQIQDVQAIVKELTGSEPRFFRPPFGSGGDAVKAVAEKHQLLYMTWSNGSEDWVAKYQNPEGLTKRVMEQLHSGSNILMHELPWTVEALDHLLLQLKEKGYSFVDPRSIEVPSP
jgi:peptidoglycan-N-acetylglucosamine deacetylase